MRDLFTTPPARTEPAEPPPRPYLDDLIADADADPAELDRALRALYSPCAITIDVEGDPLPKGSFQPRTFFRKGLTKAAVLAGLKAAPAAGMPFLLALRKAIGLQATVESKRSEALKDWESAIRAAATDVFRAPIPEPRAVAVRLAIWIARPKAHYRTGRYADLLRPDAPRYPTNTNTGDVDKLTRAVFDGLSGAAYDDDRQVVAPIITQSYYAPSGISVTVAPID